MPAFALMGLMYASGAVAAGMNLTMVRSGIQDDVLHITAELELELGSRVEEAVRRGIPIEIVVDVALERHRRVLWDAAVKTWEVRRRIQFNALSQQYVVQGFGAGTQSFYGLDPALTYLGALRDIALILPQELALDQEYLVSLRARIDVESLPAAVRPLAYASAAWRRVGSDWKEWKVGE